MNAGHPDTDTLADYAEELLAPDAAAALETHVSSCADCTATLAALAELSHLLADQPVPSMPEDIARRIDDALAQEAAQPAEETEAAPEPPLRPLPHAAGQAHRPHRTRRIITRSLVGLAAAAVIGLTGQAIVHSGGSSASSSSAGARSGAAATARVFTRSSLAAEANSLLAVRTSSGSTSTHPQALTGGQGEPGTVNVPACALKAAGHQGAAPLASGAGFFEGTAVYALIYPEGATSLDVVLVRADCQSRSPGYGTDRNGAGDVLLEQTVPRS